MWIVNLFCRWCIGGGAYNCRCACEMKSVKCLWNTTFLISIIISLYTRAHTQTHKTAGTYRACMGGSCASVFVWVRAGRRCFLAVQFLSINTYGLWYCYFCCVHLFIRLKFYVVFRAKHWTRIESARKKNKQIFCAVIQFPRANGYRWISSEVVFISAQIRWNANFVS